MTQIHSLISAVSIELGWYDGCWYVAITKMLNHNYMNVRASQTDRDDDSIISVFGCSILRACVISENT